MKLDYSVKPKVSESEKKENIKTRTSMQSTVMNALASRAPQAGGQPQPDIAPAGANGWGGA